MQAHVRIDVMRFVGPVVTSDLSDVSCLSSIPVVIKACVILGVLPLELSVCETACDTSRHGTFLCNY
jgi:hypothetical protein